MLLQVVNIQKLPTPDENDRLSFLRWKQEHSRHFPPSSVSEIYDFEATARWPLADLLPLRARPEIDGFSQWMAYKVLRRVPAFSSPVNPTTEDNTNGQSRSRYVNSEIALQLGSAFGMVVVAIICVVTTLSLSYAQKIWLRLIIMAALNLILCVWACFCTTGRRIELFMLVLT